MRLVDPSDILRAAQTLLLIDYPGRVVPETLARAGFTVVAHEGPSDDDYYSYAIDGDDVAATQLGRPPDHADLVYVHRPVNEWPGITELARQIGATTLWSETPQPGGREIVEAAGLAYVDALRIVDAVAAL